MTTTNSTARPARPTHVSHPTITAMVDEMRAACRDELVHYAGASHLDDVAWKLCLAWLASPNAPESELKAAALNATGWGPITAADLRAANPRLR